MGRDENVLIFQDTEKICKTNEKITYDQVNEIISRIEDMTEDGLQGKEKGTEEGELSQLKALVSYLRMIMEENPDTNLIGMLS